MTEQAPGDRAQRPPLGPVAGGSWPQLVIDERSVPIDYLAQPYELTGDAMGQPNGLQLLVDTLPLDHHAAWQALVPALQGSFGPGRVVWGVKVERQLLSWEIYLYGTSVSQARDRLPPLLSWSVRDEPIPSGMVSFEVVVHGCGLAPIATVDFYNGDATAAQPATCHTLDSQGVTLKNLYTFVPSTDLEAVNRRLINGGHYWDRSVPPSAVARPDLDSCHTVCVAAKHCCDGVYFGGVREDQFLAFLPWAGFPDDLVATIHARAGHLGHLRFDVGFDYHVRSGRVEVLKAGFYGWF